MMKNALYGGVNAAVLTAMNDDLSVDLDRMAAHSQWLLANGCNGLGVLGTTGEANSIGVNERMEVLEGLVARGVPAAKMMPGTGMPSITDTVLLSKHAASLGARGVLVLPPYYYKNPSDDGLFAFFSEVVQRIGTGLPIYLYNFPQQAVIPFTFALIARLLKAYPGVIRGAKDSSGNFENTGGMAKEFGKDGFEVYAGDDALLQDLLKVGGAGCITAASNVSCAWNQEVWQTWNSPAGDAAQERLSVVRKAVISVPLIPGLKALKARHTGDARWHHIRPPHMKLTLEQQAILFHNFDACGVTLAKAA
ncbi:MAG: dihydrodipicolinate synthase family protein [Acetobacteraceae bacterium]|nr:dihydrodipicolinate synthase family protein [Acetobacteraceae bacterium]MSP29323.1 dihydrodipicolinate synthase family protein [Acetobacteraceae bacterium]